MIGIVSLSLKLSKKIFTMIEIDNHTIEESLIDPNGWILDLGCINFKFANEVKKYCKNIICVDPNPTIDESPIGIFFERYALVSNDVSEVDFFIYDDKHGYSLLNPDKDWCMLKDKIRVPAINIQELMKKYGVEKFELIKIDIEGGEYGLLESWDWSISKQFSVEFHDFRFMNPYYPYNEKYYENLFEKKMNTHRIIKHNLTDHPGFPAGCGRNYWDSLFIQKNLKYENFI